MQPPNYWYEKAEEARALAGQMTTRDAQETLAMIADQYDRLARVAERDEARRAANPSADF